MNMRTKKTKAVGIPTVDLSSERSTVKESIVTACEEYGFFKVVNHGVPPHVIARLEEEGSGFFSKTVHEKQRGRVGPASPFGYGSKNIGRNGDMGELEYLLLHTHPLSVSETSKTLSNDPSKFSCAVNDYTEAVRELACEILDLVGEGLWISDKFSFSRLIRDVKSDSLLRLNHYPPVKDKDCINEWDPPMGQLHHHHHHRHHHQHTAAANNDRGKERMSMVYFGAPPLNAWIHALPEMVSAERPIEYRPFTWAQFKNAAFSLRLADSRLDLFKISSPLPHDTHPLKLPF
ncbi:hypothetical protein TIFTF001_021406 [Ficus carica]|uniref:Non-haem dioxygenase N-terminal domain-containing protein n=1 Tax=Ficus carica TaxID=3494 RepID=A0AA88DEJ0_FICCA|nr:hypothetical protein TIFTF001_021406 [Ficus carica]